MEGLMRKKIQSLKQEAEGTLVKSIGQGASAKEEIKVRRKRIELSSAKHILAVFFLFFVSRALIADVVPYYRSKGILASNPVKDNSEFIEYDLVVDETDPATQVPLKVLAHYFQNKTAGKHPLLILVPPINGVSSREISVTKHFLKQGYSTVVVEPIKNIANLNIPVDEFQDNLLSFVGAVRSVVDVMNEKPEIDSNNVFVWASSMGAIYSSIVLGLDQRINAGIVIVGGGSIADIVTDSKQRYIKSYRLSRMEKENLTLNAFREKMKEEVKVDPLVYAKLRSPSDILFVMSLNDPIVATPFQEALYESFGSPVNLIRYRKGHATVLVRTHLYDLDRFSDFTNSKLRR
jgi:hypothetical protein